MKTLLPFALVAMAAAGVALAAEKPSLAGSWKMDPKQSDFGAGPPPDSFTRTIEQNDPALVMTDAQTSALGDDKAVRKYSTDGKEITYHWMGNDVVSAAHWEERALVVIGKLNAGGSDVVVTSRLTLSADGKTLTENGKIAVGGNDLGEYKLVLVKQ